MNLHASKLRSAQRIGCVVFVLTLFFCSMEMVPGWSRLGLGWSPTVFYGIMSLAGALAGSLIPEDRLAGIPSGALAGVGALFAQAFALARVDEIWSPTMCFIAALGMLPGIGMYYGIRILFSRASFIDNAIESIAIGQNRRADKLQELAQQRLFLTGCPVCGGTRFRRKWPQENFALLFERICLDCGTRYAPPMPRWTAFIYHLVGLVCFICCAGWLWRNQNWPGPRSLENELIVPLFIAVLGLISFGVGFRCRIGQPRSRVIQRGRTEGE